MDLLPDEAVQVLLGILQAGREQLAGQQLKGLNLVRHQPGVADHDLVGLLLPQIAELLQHLVGGLEVDGQGRVSVRELFRGQQDMAVHLVLWLLEVDVTGGTDGLAQLVAQADDGSVQLP